MGKIQLEKTAEGIVIRQYDDEILNEVTVPHALTEQVAPWVRDFHPVGTKVTVGGDDLNDFPS